MAIPPILIKLGVKLLANKVADALLSKLSSASDERNQRINQSLLPSNNPYLKGNKTSATDLPISALFSLLSSTQKGSGTDALRASAENIDQVVPFEINDTLNESLQSLLGKDAVEKFQGVFKGLDMSPFGDVNSSDIKEGLSSVLDKLKESSFSSLPEGMLSRRFQSTVASTVASRKESTLSSDELAQMAEAKASFERFSNASAMDNPGMGHRMGPKPDFSL